MNIPEKAGRKVEAPTRSDPVQYVMNKKDSDLTDDEFKYSVLKIT